MISSNRLWSSVQNQDHPGVLSMGFSPPARERREVAAVAGHKYALS
jgi:hypothetical protein